MKKILLSLVFLSQFATVFAQRNNNSSKPSLHNWIVLDFQRARSSFEGVRLDSMELNSDYTIAHMSFHNLSFFDQHIEACNSFHIMSNKKKIADFVKAENIPTRKVNYEEVFECADIEKAMRIKPGQFVRFRIFFTRIPEDLNRIDIVEFDGQQDCEFDVWNLNIARKQTLVSPTLSRKKPKIEIQNPPKPTLAMNQKPKKKTQSGTKIPSKTTPEATTTEEKKDEITIASKGPKPETREVNIRKEFQVSPETLKLEIWDNDKEDGDVVSVMLNERWIFKGFKVTKNHKKVEIPLVKGVNTLTFHADNLGSAPPNTAALSFWDGTQMQTIILNSDMQNSEAIRLIRK